MKIYSNHSLKNHNSFKVDVKAKYFIKITQDKDVSEFLDLKKYHKDIFILGGGSNILFQKNYPGTVVQIATKGINVIKEDNTYVLVEISAGESWNGFVHWAINNGYAGIENMILIPGTVGAAASQNIAAYGQNIEDVFESLDAVDISSGKSVVFDKKAMKLGYRESIFKRELRNKFIITNVRIKLGKNDFIDMSYHSRYESLEGELSKFASPPYNIRDIAKAVSVIRERKFPDWEKIGTAGSFFLNPVIAKKELIELQKKVPNVQFYPIDKLTYPTPDDPKFVHADHVKIAAGWLLEELGWKGKWIGRVGTSPNQSLVIITQKGATAQEIIAFADKMKADAKKAYGITLLPEVNII